MTARRNPTRGGPRFHPGTCPEPLVSGPVNPKEYSAAPAGYLIDPLNAAGAVASASPSRSAAVPGPPGPTRLMAVLDFTPVPVRVRSCPGRSTRKKCSAAPAGYFIDPLNPAGAIPSSSPLRVAAAP